MKMLRVGALILFTLLLFFVLYAAVTVARAYAAAPDLVARAMAARPMNLRPDSLPAGFLTILLAVEDPAFYSHHGIDLGTPGAGYTTITQGLVKSLYFDRFTPGVAKIRQTLIAIGFNRRIDKTTQMTLFLNSVHMGTRPDGREIHGLEAAAQEYFGKEISSLTREEFIALVAMIVGPDAFAVRGQPERNAERAGRIQRLLDGKCRPRGLRDVYYEDCAAESAGASAVRSTR